MNPPLPKLRGIFLTMGDYGGTLAAMRSSGRTGTPVLLGEWRKWTTAGFSRFLTKRLSCPPLQQWENYIDWLVKLGESNPGLFLYPTSDDTAWLYAAHSKRLEANFHLWQPAVHVIYSLLNKKMLSEACEAVGIASPPTFFPESEAELAAVLAKQKAPFLLKPRTQIGLKVGHKGRIVNAGEDFRQTYLSFKEQLQYQKQLLASDPVVGWPMIQEYFAVAAQSIVSIAGFVGADGRIVARSSRKVLQRPRKLGIGLCFESITVDQELLAQLQRLCQKLGYFGVFEAEFIEDSAAGKKLLIDFNPRYYGQMGFEIARGLNLPLLALNAACHPDDLREQLDQAERAVPLQTHVYSTRWLLKLSLWAGFLGRKHSWAEVKGWGRWRRAHHYTDAVYDAQDPWPYYFDMLFNGARYLRHPRDFIRKFFFDT